MLKRFNMDKSKATPVPLAKGDKFSEAQYPKNQLELDEMKDIPYASAVGSLMCMHKSVRVLTWHLLPECLEDIRKIPERSTG